MFKPVGGFAAITLALAAAPALAADKAEKPAEVMRQVQRDEAALQGTWKVESLRHGGREAPAELRDQLKLEVKGGALIIRHTGGPADEAAREYTINAGKSPKTIDIKMEKGSDKVLRGIYRLSGDRLEMCWDGRPDGERPMRFDSGSDAALMVLRREKK